MMQVVGLPVVPTWRMLGGGDGVRLLGHAEYEDQSSLMLVSKVGSLKMDPFSSLKSDCFKCSTSLPSM